MKNKIIKTIKEPARIFSYLSSKRYLDWVSDETYLKLVYKIKMKEALDLENIKTYNQKLQWLKINDRNPLYTKLVDKYEVRQYIADKIGEEYLIPLIGIYDNFNDINFDELPEQFVLKCTHDSGGIVICKDKNKLDKEAARKKINKSLKRNYYYLWREWPYKNVKPRIICEKYMEDKIDKDLKDYKFLCFNGEVKCMHVCSDRDSNSEVKIDYYDREWNYMNITKLGTKSSGNLINKPISFDKMIELAEILSKDIPFIRVDFYDINGKIYFGELTFYPDAGVKAFTSYSHDELLGSWITLH